MLEDKSSEFLERAKKKDIALLVYGDPLIATTHIALLKEAKKIQVKTEVIHNVSILNAIAQTGLSIYKFGKIASMPEWKQDYKPESFYETIKQNLSIQAHTLLLVDIPLSFKTAVEQLRAVDKQNLLKEVFVCSRIGTKEQKILKIDIKKGEKNEIKKPFCFIIPASLEFYER